MPRRLFPDRDPITMTPSFAQSVDPISLHVIELLDRIAAGRASTPADERLRIVSLIDQAEAQLGSGREWELAKYALVSWVDEMMLEAAWDGRDWWTNNVLEVELFNTRLCNEQFFLKAREAAALSRRDALEVYYNCVILGFRGLYRDPELAVMFTQAHGLPEDLATWTRQAALSIRVGQDRPPLAGPQREIAGAPPLRAKPRIVWGMLAMVLLIASNVIAYKLVFDA